MESIDKRMFYLMLSPVDGQNFANAMGFSPPSIEVQEMEIMDILYRWAFILRSGVMDVINENIDWFITLLELEDKISSPIDEFKAALTSFSIAMLNTLMDTNLVGIVLDDEIIGGLGQHE